MRYTVDFSFAVAVARRVVRDLKNWSFFLISRRE